MSKKHAVEICEDDYFDELEDDAGDEEDLTSVQKVWRARQVAVLFCTGKNFSEIAEDLEVTRDTIKRWFNTSECQKVISKIQNSDIKLARNSLREVLPDFCKRLKEDIQNEGDNTYQAMKLYAKVMGLDERQKGADSALASYEEVMRLIFGDDDDDAIPEVPPTPKLLSDKPETNSHDDDDEEEDSSEVTDDS